MQERVVFLTAVAATVLGACGGGVAAQTPPSDSGTDATATPADAAIDAPAPPSDSGVDGGPLPEASAVDAADAASDSTADAGPIDAGDAGEDAACTLGTQRCSDDAGVETCGADGGWSAPWPCATGTCSAGACTGATAGSSSPSCAPGGAGMTNCGESDGGESCCTSGEVPGGAYDRTYTNSGDGGTGEADPARLSGFRLDKYMVTVGRFRQFVHAVLPPDGGAGWSPPPGSGKHAHLNGGAGLADGPNVGAAQTYEPGWLVADNARVAPTDAHLECYTTEFDTWTSSPGSQENLPMNCINWWEAYAFCIWDGGFLPSEAESGYAAAGGSEEREYPWGSADPGTASQYAIYNCDYPSGQADGGIPSCGVQTTAPVGFATLGAGAWGQLDLVGELWEWNLDWYAPYASPCVDCANLTQAGATNRANRGGNDIDAPTSFLLSSFRGFEPPAVAHESIGFRCARTP